MRGKRETKSRRTSPNKLRYEMTAKGGREKIRNGGWRRRGDGEWGGVWGRGRKIIKRTRHKEK